MGHDGSLPPSLTLGLGLLAATMTLVTAGSVGIMGFLLGKQLSSDAQAQQPRAKGKKHGGSSHYEHELFSAGAHPSGPARRLRIPSGTASEDVRVSDKKAIVDVRITAIRPLISPAILVEEIPLTKKIAQTVSRSLLSRMRAATERCDFVGECNRSTADARAWPTSCAAWTTDSWSWSAPARSTTLTRPSTTVSCCLDSMLPHIVT